MNRNELLAAAGLSVFTPRLGQSPQDYAVAQMKGRGDSFSVGPFRETGRKIVEAQAVNGVALVVLSRVNLTEAAKDDVKGYQITVFDLAGSVISESPLDDTAPKGNKRGFDVYGATLQAIAGRSDLIAAAVRSARDAAQSRVNELDALLSECAPSEIAESDADETADEPQAATG